MEDEQKEELQKAYQAIIVRKDKEIEKLKEENMLLMKTALKRADEMEQMREIVIKMRKKESECQTLKKEKLK